MSEIVPKTDSTIGGHAILPNTGVYTVCGCNDGQHRVEDWPSIAELAGAWLYHGRLVEALEDLYRCAQEHNAYPQNVGCESCNAAHALLAKIEALP